LIYFVIAKTLELLGVLLITLFADLSYRRFLPPITGF